MPEHTPLHEIAAQVSTVVELRLVVDERAGGKRTFGRGGVVGTKAFGLVEGER